MSTVSEAIKLQVLFKDWAKICPYKVDQQKWSRNVVKEIEDTLVLRINLL